MRILYTLVTDIVLAAALLYIVAEFPFAPITAIYAGF